MGRREVPALTYEVMTLVIEKGWLETPGSKGRLSLSSHEMRRRRDPRLKG